MMDRCRLTVFLTGPAVDRTIAAVACGPFVYALYRQLQGGALNVARVDLAVQCLIMVGPMLIRRPPARVTTDPWLWLLTGLATYWTLLTAGITEAGTPVIPVSAAEILSLFGLAVTIAARVSLGRNIGFVPAQRRLVTRGAYAVVRHPIYTGIFVSYLAFVLWSYTPLNVAIAGLGVLWFIIKSFVEEEFLRVDPAYSAYMERVPWRWLPWIA